VTTLGLARWYVDAHTLGLAHVLIRARPDVTFPGDDGTRHTARWTLPPCPIQQTSTRDTEWIPKVAAADDPDDRNRPHVIQPTPHKMAHHIYVMRVII
jgi:hypothetical protein